MKLYNKKTGELKDTPCDFDGISYPFAIPKKKIYEYVKPDYNSETQTLGEIYVENDIATNKIIEFSNWEYLEFPIRITVKQNDLRYGEVLQNLTFDMLVDNPPQNVYWKEVEVEPDVFEKLKFVTVYLKYLYSKDKFNLDTETNIISASSSLAGFMEIEQLDDAIFEITRINGKEAIAKVRSTE